MTIKPNAGKFDRRMTIWQNVPTVNDDGQNVEVPTKIFERWGKILPVSGMEPIEALQQHADLTHKVRMRHDTQTATITAEMWLTKRNGDRLNIKAVRNVEEMDVEIEIDCIQRT